MAVDIFPSSQASHDYASTPQQNAGPHQGYSLTRQLTFELCEHCGVYLQEELYSQALALLTSLLSSNEIYPSPVQARPLCVPNSQILALISTLIVYPQTTTRLPTTQRIEAANQALIYLTHLHKIVGPIDAGFGEAFRFSGQSPSRTRRRDRLGKGDVSENDEADGKITTKIATSNSLFNRREDFWAVVGWAFNCSVKYPNRWERWKLWLELMLDILASDMRERLILAKHSSSANRENQHSLADSLLGQYLSASGETRNDKRRVMRAILADGSKKSMAEFGEVWKNETAPPKVTDQDRPQLLTKRIDLDNEDFGDYMDVDSSDDNASMREDTSKPNTRRLKRNKSEVSSDLSDLSDLDSNVSSTNTPAPAISVADTDTSTLLGGLPSVHLRLRLLSLIATFTLRSNSSTTQQASSKDIESLLDIYTEFLLPLPLPIFTYIVLPTTPWLPDPDVHSSLIQMLLRPLISSDAKTYNANYVTQTDLEAYFLPWTAGNSAVGAQARVSLGVEGLMVLLWREGGLELTESLRGAVRKGLDARERKAGGDGRKRSEVGRREDESAMEVLRDSGARMMALLDLL